jgi:hypothetical protein
MLLIKEEDERASTQRPSARWARKKSDSNVSDSPLPIDAAQKNQNQIGALLKVRQLLCCNVEHFVLYSTYIVQRHQAILLLFG